MKIEGEYTFSVPRDLLWSALIDPDIIAGTLPGCESLEEVGENEYRSDLKIKIGPVQGRFQGRFQISRLIPPESYHMKLSGQGTVGFMEGEGDVRLVEQDESTVMHYAFDVQIGGKVAAVGQRLLESSAKAITRQGLQQLNQMVELMGEEPDGGAEIQHQYASPLSGGMLSDLGPRERRIAMLVASAGVLVLFWIFLAKACA